jgi:hypothetical protein
MATVTDDDVYDTLAEDEPEPAPEPRDEGVADDGLPVIEDAGVLEAAEQAAREAESYDDAVGADAEAATAPGESWVKVATAPSADPGRSLEPIYVALCEAGIPASFDPYRPGVAASPYPFLQRAFHVVVPASRLDEARAALADMRVEIPGEGTGSRDAEPTAAPHVPGPGETRAPMSARRKVALVVIALLLVAFVVQLVGSMIMPWVFAHS